MNNVQFVKVSGDKRFGRMMMMIFGGFFLVIIMALIFGFLLKFLWNVTIAELFGISAITYWQAIGLFILAKFFFGFGHGGGFQHHDHKKNRDKWQQWWGPGPEDNKGPEDDAMLQKYWQEEGRQAYADYLASRDGKQQDGQEE